MSKMMAFLSKHWLTVLVVLVLLIVGTGGYQRFQRARYTQWAQANPSVFDPYKDAMILYNAMKSTWDPSTWGTDEDAIFGVLIGKNQEQLAAIYNEFNFILSQNNETGDLISWLSEDLSGSQLSQALAFFEGMGFN